MNEQQIRQSIIEACLFLQEKGLIARTWGNVSARLNENEFIITPSGLAYELTKPEDLVVVKIEDCSYDQTQRKPSSEKRIHAEAYKLRNDVNFIVHTHQFYASAICAQEEDIALDDGSFIPCAKYGLPGTKKLATNVTKTYQNNLQTNCFLLAKHGAVCFGKDKNDALNNALYLENECQKLFTQRVSEFKVLNNMKPYLDDYAQLVPCVEPVDDPEALKMVTEKNSAACLYVRNGKPLNFFDAKLQNFVYKTKYSKLRNKR